MAAKHDGKHARANMWVTHQNLARAKSGRPFHDAKSRKGLPPAKAKVAPAAKRPEEILAPRALVQAWVEAFNRADGDALAGFYAEDAVNHQVAEAPVAGRQAIREMFASGLAMTKMVCVPENLFEEGEWAILEWRDPQGLRGSGFFHVVKGRIVLQRGYGDKLALLRSHKLPLPAAL